MDEVQDNLLIDTLGMYHISVGIFACLTIQVLRTICPNQHGLFWVGDTAQVRAATMYGDWLTLL